MSLAILADHMASKGRGPDSMLVHMAPSEVRGLQALAMKHGGSLTINPETGLPEAGFLSKLLPAIIGFALNTFAPGVGTAIGGALGTSAAVGTGLLVGGVEALRTGDIGRGLSAGLGAYGGAGLAGSLAGAGTGALSAEAGNAALAAQGMTGVEALSPAADEIAQRAISERLAAATPYETMSAGLDKAAANPTEFLKANAKPLMYTAAPLLAGDITQANMPKTVTKPGMIRPYSFDAYSGRYTAGTPYEVAPVKVAEGGLMGMDDGGYSPGMLDFVQRSEPVARMAEGGIAALAAGGTSYKNLTKDSSEDEIAAAYKQFTAGAGGNTQENQAAAIDYLGKLGIGEDRIGGAYTKFQASPTYTDYTQQDVVNFLKSNKNADIAAETAKFNANPLLVNQTISGLTAGYTDPTQTTGGSGSRQYYDALLSAGIDADELFSANQALNADYSFADDKTAGGLRRAFDVASDFRGFDPAGDTQLLKDIEWVKKMDIDGANTVDIARLTGLSINEVATREAAARAALAATGGGGGGGVGGGGDGVGGGGKTVVNPDGSVTTTPDIPGRPEGGFKGMKDVRDAYTAGGGSLGYIPYAPKTIEEFNTKYADRLTGGSKQSYDYLTGKTPYSPTPYTPTGEVMKPYAESVLGIPTPSANKQYLFDPKTRQYKINPDYAIPTRDSEGKVSYDLTNNDVVEFFSTSPTDDAFFSWATTNNLSAEQIASATGMPVSEVYKRIKKGKPAKDASTETTEDGTGLSVPDIVGANGGLMAMAGGGMAGQYDLGGYSDGGRLLRGPGDGVSDSIPATIGNKRPARLADGEFVVPARIVSELGNGSTEAGARKLYAMMERVQAARRGTVGKRKVAKNSRADKYLPA